MQNFPLKQRLVMYFLLAMVIVMQGLVLFWSFWPYEPLRVEHIKILKFENGSRLLYELKGEKFLSIPADVTRQFVDGIIVSLPPISGNIEAGKFQKLFSVNIPKIPKGKYYMRWSATYKVNPIREVTVTSMSHCFEVN